MYNYIYLSLSLECFTLCGPGNITVPLTTVKPAQLYHHILAHSDVFGMQSLELRPAGKGSSDSLSQDICLHIDVCPEKLGPTTSPQLSKLLRDAQESYSIHVLVMHEEDNPHCLNLVFYLLLVNIHDKFPRLTLDTSSHTSSSTTQSGNPLHSPEDLTHHSESELHMSVRKRRLKLGLDPLLRPTSSASQLVLDDALMREHVRSLQGHFEGVVKNAIHHMRRDELWKRVLYGRYRSEHTKPAMMQVRVGTFVFYHLCVL